MYSECVVLDLAVTVTESSHPVTDGDILVVVSVPVCTTDLLVHRKKTPKTPTPTHGNTDYVLRSYRLFLWYF